jgi:hypothetical protein
MLSLEAIGPLTRVAAPAYADLIAEFKEPKLGSSPTRRAACCSIADVLEDQLRQGKTAVAALDDLYAGICDLSTTHDRVVELLDVLGEVLRMSRRSLSSDGHVLGSVLDDEVWGVDIVRPHDAPPPSFARRPDTPAGLTESERLNVCRDFLQQPRAARRAQAAWVCFERATCLVPRTVSVGPVTFIDGPTLQSAVNSIAAGSAIAAHIREHLPQEVLDADEFFAQSLDVGRDNDGVKEWVWARVELDGTEQSPAIEHARTVASGLVGLAAFYDRGTRWKLMTGGILVHDGRPSFGPFVFRQPDKSEHDSPFTSETLGEIGEQIEPGSPTPGEQLLGLLATANLVRVNGLGDPSPSGLLIDVQVIEAMASQAGASNWQRHTKGTFALTWAQQTVANEIINAHSTPTDVYDLSFIPEVAAIDGLHEPVHDSRIPRFHFRFELALERLAGLVSALPDHAPGARRLRTLDRRIATTSAATAWVDELVAQFEQGVDRLARCRNAGAHGGPTELGVIASVREFANREAARTINMGIWATVKKEKLAASHDRVRAQGLAWHQALKEGQPLSVATLIGPDSDT